MYLPAIADFANQTDFTTMTNITGPINIFAIDYIIQSSIFRTKHLQSQRLRGEENVLDVGDVWDNLVPHPLCSWLLQPHRWFVSNIQLLLFHNVVED